MVHPIWGEDGWRPTRLLPAYYSHPHPTEPRPPKKLRKRVRLTYAILQHRQERLTVPPRSIGARARKPAAWHAHRHNTIRPEAVGVTSNREVSKPHSLGTRERLAQMCFSRRRFLLSHPPPLTYQTFQAPRASPRLQRNDRRRGSIHHSRFTYTRSRFTVGRVPSSALCTKLTCRFTLVPARWKSSRSPTPSDTPF